MRDFFSTYYQGCEFRQLQPDDMMFEIKLSEDARFDLERFIIARRLIGQTRLTQSTYKPIRCQFKNQVSQQRRTECEQINHFHPLTRFVSEHIQSKLLQLEKVHFPTVSIRLNHKEIPVLKSQDYIFYVERGSVQGVKEIERMVYFAKSTIRPFAFLSEEIAEQLITIAAKVGIDWLSAANELNIENLVPILEDCQESAEKRYSDYITFLQNENNDRADLQEKTLKLHMDRQREKLLMILKKHEEMGRIQMLAPTRGQLEKMETKVRDKLRLIEDRRKLQHHRKEVCVGIIRVK